VLAEIAASFEEVWHQRTRLFEEVQRLREQVEHREELIARLQTEVAGLSGASEDTAGLDGEPLEPGAAPPAAAEADAAPTADTSVVEHMAAELREQSDHLLGEIHNGGVSSADERKKLLEFLLDALRRVDEVSTNGGSPGSADRDGTEQPADTLAGVEPRPSSGVLE